MISFQPMKALLDTNLEFIARFSSKLAQDIYTASKTVQLVKANDGGFSLSVGEVTWFDNVCQAVKESISVQLQDTNRVRFQRVRAGLDIRSVGDILSDLVDTERLVVLEQMPSLQEDCLPTDSQIKELPLAKDTLLLGSLCLLGIEELLFSNILKPSQSFLLVETDLSQLAAVFSLINLSQIVDTLKSEGKGFDLLFIDQNSTDYGPLLLDKIAKSNPLSIHGLWIYRSPKLSPVLTKLNSWCHSSDGLLDYAKGFLGNDTDEFNQVLHATWNLVRNNQIRLIRESTKEVDLPVLIVASGPSLDDQLAWLRENHDKFTIISAGSSIGSLLKAGIHVDAAIILEMGSIVYRDLSNLCFEGYSLNEINLIASITIDPRISDLFKSVYFFNRPLSAASALFEDLAGSSLIQAGPQAANAAIEVVLHLGIRKILLLGCDFAAKNPLYPRSLNAIGTSPRDLILPVPGNMGKTVYSSAELSVARQLLENAIGLYSANVMQIGEGAKINRVGVVEDLNGIVSVYSGNPLELHELLKCDSNPVFTKKLKLHDKFLLASSWGSTRTDKVILSLQSTSGWSHLLSKEYGQLVTWSDDHLESYQRLRHRLTRFPYFILFQPLHDDDSTCWDTKRESGIMSLRQIDKIYKTYFDFLAETANSSYLPPWDPQWVRERLSKMAISTDQLV